MSIYTEFAKHVEERQERLARRQLWFRMRRALAGERESYLVVGTILLTLAAALLFAEALRGL